MSNYGYRDNSIRTKKIIVKDKIPMQYVIPKTDAVSTVAIKAGWDVSAGTTALVNATIEIQPPYPVNLTVQAVAAGTADNSDKIVIVGRNAKGQTITESVAVSSTAGAINKTSNAFAYITSMTPDDALHKSTDVNIGISSALGLPYPIDGDADIISYAYDGTYATAIGASGALNINATYDTFTPPTIATDKVIQFTYKTTLQDL